MAHRKTSFTFLGMLLICLIALLAPTFTTAMNARAQSGTDEPTQAATSSASTGESRLVYLDVVPTTPAVMTFFDPISKDTRNLAFPAGLTPSNAALSPDGSWVAVVAHDVQDSNPTNATLYVMKIDGSDMQAVSEKPDQAGTSNTIVQPVWSADSKQLLYFLSVYSVSKTAVKALGGHVMLATIDGSSPIQQIEIKPNTPTKFNALLSSPAWSPDGKTILFMASSAPSGSTPGPYKLWRMDADGNHAALFKEQGQVPAWSPDGCHVALYTAAGNLEITDPDGSHPRKVAALARGSYVVALTWSPDGTQLAYTIIKQSKSPLYVLNADGSSKPSQIQEFKGHSLTLVWMNVPYDVLNALPQAAPTASSTMAATAKP